jgi:hypothetical protein
VIPPPPVLDEHLKATARVFAKDTDAAGELVAALLMHITAVELHAKVLTADLNRAESQALEMLRVASMPTPAPQWPSYGRGAA